MNTLDTQPTTIVIFGVTGDLAERKLLPALRDLYISGQLPSQVRIVGTARGKMSDDDFRAHLKKSLGEDTDSAFLALFSYVSIDLTKKDDHPLLVEHVEKIEKESGCMNRLFYLAVPPSLFTSIIVALETCGIATSKNDFWRRILVEKPFGFDLESAQKIDHALNRVFEAEDVFRIDHYLAKNAAQNIIAFRFSNILFQHAWNREHIESIHIKLYEKSGAEGRGAFYEQVGALRDVGQNHLLQMLALVTMEHPRTLSADAVSASRATVLKDLMRYTDEEQVAVHTARGQYAGYRDIEGVDPSSNTETYFALRAYIKNARWQGVPCILEGGKRMPEDTMDITVQFKPPVPCVCGVEDASCGHGNRLVFSVKPKQKVTVYFWVKKQGLTYELEEQELAFSYVDDPNMPDAYAQLVRNALTGERLVFPSEDEIEAAWTFITPILNIWSCVPFTFYEQGMCPDATRLLKNKK